MQSPPGARLAEVRVARPRKTGLLPQRMHLDTVALRITRCFLVSLVTFTVALFWCDCSERRQNRRASFCHGGSRVCARFSKIKRNELFPRGGGVLREN